MYNITLISTAHTEYGKCNSDELYKIIEDINPQIIFEEMPEHLFDVVYNNDLLSDHTLETKCIKRYSKDYSVKHIPVDYNEISDLPTDSINFMFDTFNKYDVYREIEKEQYLMAHEYGFTFLNSQRCSDLFTKKKETEQYLLNFGIQNIYKSFYDEQDNREPVMLSNIYNYSKLNPYSQGVFLLGAGHRNSIMKKIKDYSGNTDFKLNWKFYNPEDSNK